MQQKLTVNKLNSQILSTEFLKAFDQGIRQATGKSIHTINVNDSRRVSIDFQGERFKTTISVIFENMANKLGIVSTQELQNYLRHKLSNNITSRSDETLISIPDKDIIDTLAKKTARGKNTSKVSDLISHTTSNILYPTGHIQELQATQADPIHVSVASSISMPYSSKFTSGYSAIVKITLLNSMLMELFENNNKERLNELLIERYGIVTQTKILSLGIIFDDKLFPKLTSNHMELIIAVGGEPANKLLSTEMAFEKLGVDYIAELTLQKSRHIQEGIADSSYLHKLPKHAINNLATSTHNDVRAAVAGNVRARPFIDQSILINLMGDVEPIVRRSSAAAFRLSDGIPKENVWALFNDSEELVVIEACKNPDAIKITFDKMPEFLKNVNQKIDELIMQKKRLKRTPLKVYNELITSTTTQNQTQSTTNSPKIPKYTTFILETNAHLKNKLIKLQLIKSRITEAIECFDR